MKNTYYFFADVETTGLNYYNDGKERENKLLEIAWILTDSDLNILHKDSLVASHKKEQIIRTMDPKIVTMHTENNLLDDIEKTCLSLDLIDSMITKMLSEYTEDNAIILLAGSSVAFDKEVIRRNLPGLYSRLYYRIMDISSFRQCLSIVFPESTKQAEENKAYKHRAKEDIMETYKEMLGYIQTLQKLSGKEESLCCHRFKKKKE